jgi:hypothetical protein
VFGRRPDYVEQDAGSWELVPSGGIDGSSRNPDGSIDLVQHALAELAEETGIAGATVVTALPFAMVYDPTAEVSDVGILLRTRLSMAEVMTAFASLGTREYVALEVVPVGELADFIKSRAQPLAQATFALLNAANPLLGSA